MAKRDYKLTNVNKGFADWIKKDSPYKGLSMNKATKRLKEDITSGKMINNGLNSRIDKLEEMLYGKGKKKSML